MFPAFFPAELREVKFRPRNSHYWTLADPAIGRRQNEWAT